MCIGCHWASFRDYIAASSSEAGGPTAVAATAAAPSFVAEAVAADDGWRLRLPQRPRLHRRRAKPWARAVAVKGKRIVYVGDEAGAKPSSGRRRASSTSRQDAASGLRRRTHPSPRRRDPHARRRPSTRHPRGNPRRRSKPIMTRSAPTDIVRGLRLAIRAPFPRPDRARRISTPSGRSPRHPDRHRRSQRLGQLAGARARRRHQGHQGSAAGIQRLSSGTRRRASRPAISSRSRP